MIKLSEEVRNILDADCARSMGEFIMQASDAQFAELIEVVKDEAGSTSEQRQRAVYVLGRAERADAVDAIIVAIPKLQAGGRVAAADALGRLGGDKARRAVIALSRDADAQVRKFAVKALGRLGGEDARKRMETVMARDKESFVRAAAARNLQQVR